MRRRLKRLAGRGILVETEPGLFILASIRLSLSGVPGRSGYEGYGETVDPLIVFSEHTLIDFRHHSFIAPSHHGYRWIDVKRFHTRVEPPADGGLLRALIGDDQFADGYVGGGADPASGAHGPYRVDHITADAYEPVDVTAAVGEIDRWARQFGDLPRTLTDVLEEQVYTPIRQATSRYRLNELGPDALHDWAGIHTEFHELVVMDSDTNTLVLIVAADD